MNLKDLDVVYFVKESPKNEELRYSLRSLEENWQYNRVWFVGGCPAGLKPDCEMRLNQHEPSKWENVREMMRKVCENDEITENFWLFNDDFFILRPMRENMPPQYGKTLEDRIEQIESTHYGQRTEYTKRLRHLANTLKKAGKGTLNYAMHKPMLINRKKMLEVIEKFPDEPMVRALYGNYWEIGGEDVHDMKIEMCNWKNTATAVKEWEFVSTSDESFDGGQIGRWLRDRFNTPSRFEV